LEDRRGQRRPLRQADLAEDLGEQHGLSSSQPEPVQPMLALRERLIADGRSTPGSPKDRRSGEKNRRLTGAVLRRTRSSESRSDTVNS